jgi:hypothetical protein
VFQGTHRCPIIDAQSIGKNMEVQCAAGGRHIAQTFSIIDTQSSMPDRRRAIHRQKTWRCNLPHGGAAHCTDFSNHRCPIIDAQSIGKIGRCSLQPERAANCTDFSHHRCQIFLARPLNIREHPLNKRERPLNMQERPFNFRERPVS